MLLQQEHLWNQLSQKKTNNFSEHSIHLLLPNQECFRIKSICNVREALGKVDMGSLANCSKRNDYEDMSKWNIINNF